MNLLARAEVRRFRQIACFGAVGAVATGTYALISLALTPMPVSATLASASAHLLAAVVSYVGHKYATFRSRGAHAVEVPRFLASVALGLVVAMAVPAVVINVLDGSRLAAILTACLFIPAVTYLVLDRFVFAAS